MKHFKVFNWKFTDEEIDQFIFNIKLKYRGPKLYHYNPYIHGDDESKHQARHSSFNEGVQHLTKDLLDSIQINNLSKKSNNEEVLMAPFRVTDHLDSSGKVLGIRHFSIFDKANTI